MLVFRFLIFRDTDSIGSEPELVIWKIAVGEPAQECTFENVALIEIAPAVGVSVGGGGRPMAVSRRVISAIAGLELPLGTIFKDLPVKEDEDGPIIEVLTAIIFRESPFLMSEHDREIFLSAGLDRLDSGVVDRISLDSRVIPSSDLFVGSAPLCCCSDRFRDVVEANGLSNFHFSRIRVQ